MTLKQVLYILFAVAIISYAPDYVPRVWTATQSPQKIKFIGSLNKYRQKCSESFRNAVCEIEYRIPAAEIMRTDGKIDQTLGLGFFLTDYAVKCDEKLVYAPPSGVSSALLLDAYKVYKSIDLSTLGCVNPNSITILALNVSGIATQGQTSANAVIGDRDHVSKLKRTIEFLNSGIYLLFSLVFIFTFFELKVLLSPLVLPTERKGEKLVFSELAWAGFALFKSGMLEILFLTPSSIQLLFRIQSGLSLFSHLQPIFLTQESEKISGRTRNILFSVALIGYLPFLFSGKFNYYLVYTVLISSAIALVVTGLSRSKNWMLLAFSACALIECLKVLDPKYFPTGSVSLTFIWCVQVVKSIKKIRSAGIFASANIWSRNVTNLNQSKNHVPDILRSFCRETQVGKASFFIVHTSGDHLVFTHDRDQHANSIPTSVHLNSVPAGIGNVLSTGRSIVHAKSSDPFFKNLFQRDAHKDMGIYYSILPVQNARTFVGVVAISKYDFDKDSNPVLAERLDAYLPILLNSLSFANERRAILESDERFDRVSSVLKKTSPNVVDANVRYFFEKLLGSLKSEFGWSGFFGSFDRKTELLNIVSQSYPEKHGGEALSKTSWVMREENVRAPGPVALFQSQRVIIPDVTWVNELISNNTKNFLELAKSKSLAVVPIRFNRGGTPEPYGILWLSSEKIGEFDSSFERTALLLQESLEREIYRSVHAAIEKTLIQGQVRPDIHERIMRGEYPTESGEGTLVQIDIAKSSKISKILSAERWEKFQEKFLSQAKALGSEYDFTPQMFIWDAVFFTAGRAVSQSDLVSFSQRSLEIITNLVYEFEVRSLFEEPTHVGRICAVYGDTSCSVLNGTWQINGPMLAITKKFEESLKGKPIALAIHADLYKFWPSNKDASKISPFTYSYDDLASPKNSSQKTA